jgi:hypothetical protein
VLLPVRVGDQVILLSEEVIASLNEFLIHGQEVDKN